VFEVSPQKNKKMRKQFVEGSRYLAAKTCPWACVMATVNGGYMCFESIEDYNTWKNQK